METLTLYYVVKFSVIWDVNKMNNKKKGPVSAGKALLALCTGGLSLPFMGIRKKQIRRDSSSISLNSDLVFVGYVGACCPKCAMYRDRVYSLHGRDKRFPVLPKDFRENCCGLAKFSYIYELDKHPFGPGKGDAIKYSNRPFIDDRTLKEKADYQAILDKVAEDVQREKDRVMYEKLVSILPDDTPKSFSAYRRIKKLNGESFADLKKKAKAAGIKI